jgi:hypothetical protein
MDWAQPALYCLMRDSIYHSFWKRIIIANHCWLFEAFRIDAR